MNTKIKQLDLFDGGEPLEGSGFEDEDEVADVEETAEDDMDLPLQNAMSSTAKLSGYIH